MSSLYEDVREFTIAQLAGEEHTITSIKVTAAYINAKIADGSWFGGKDDSERAALYGGVQQVVRPLLARAIPEAPEPDDPQTALDLPEEKLLQRRYSVRGEGNESYYRMREVLTEDEMMQIVSRFRALSIHFERHAKALESSWHRDHEVAVV